MNYNKEANSLTFRRGSEVSQENYGVIAYYFVGFGDTGGV